MTEPVSPAVVVDTMVVSSLLNASRSPQTAAAYRSADRWPTDRGVVRDGHRVALRRDQGGVG